jgi:hypothetical protein
VQYNEKGFNAQLRVRAPAQEACMKLRLELVTVPVSDVDRAKAFYVDQVGFSSEQDVQVEYPWGRFCFFSDPDGNGWSVHEPPSTS